MDSFTKQHLATWAETSLRDEEREFVIERMTKFVETNPDVIERSWDWPTIREVMERNEKLGLN